MRNWRVNFLLGIFILLTLLIEGRLFYWQILKSEELAAAAKQQHWISFEIPAQRGKILAADGFPLATNKEAFLVYASLPNLKEKPGEIAKKISSLLTSQEEEVKEMEKLIKERLSREDLVWVILKHKVSPEIKEKIEKLQIQGIGFEEEQKRDYPEGSSSAHLLGFVGVDKEGKDKGYFGLEGFYDLELRGQAGFLKREKDALGKPILIGETKIEKKIDGRSLLTTIDRSLQFIVEEKLRDGLKKYEATSGTVTIMDPKTGAILAMVSLPSYNPEEFWKFKKELYPNPAIYTSYEPGSVFKVIVMAAALNEGVINLETRCDKCAGPRNISGYTIKTWNDKYYPNSTISEILEHSDNVGMIFIAEKLGIEKLVNYLEKFGIGQLTGIDLQEEFSPPLRKKSEWKEIDLATASFGQGIAVTPLQMVRAVSVIANQGRLVKPYLVKEVIGEKGKIKIPLEKGIQIIKPSTAKIMTELMVNAVERGEAKWTKPKNFKIAGKTGTAQIPIAGHYDEEKTIASFVGFAPADNPQFVMLVTLREPKTSPWGSETAAPLWFDIAKELFLYFKILPE